MTTWNVRLIKLDMAAQGLNALQLARRANKSPTTITQFLGGVLQTAKTGRAIAEALGYPATDYLPSRAAAAPPPHVRSEAGASTRSSGKQRGAVRRAS